MSPEAPLTIAALGEDRLIERLRALFDRDVPKEVLGIGDDCACLAPSALGTLLTTDALVSGVHFRPEWTSAHELGMKSIAVNASDIAAMGGRPTHALLALNLAPDTPLAWFDDLVAGVQDGVRRIHAYVIGGNMTRTEGPASVTVTMVGDAPIGGGKRRSGAREGDVLCLSGFVGSSRAGLEILQRNLAQGDDVRPLLRQHRCPSAHVEEGLFLGAESAVHAMMDISDGIAVDLPRLLAASRVGAAIQLERLPLDPCLRPFCELMQTAAEPFAFVGGEDYVLLASVARETFPDVARRFSERFGRPLAQIGRVESETGLRVSLWGSDLPLPSRTFSHFG